MGLVTEPFATSNTGSGAPVAGGFVAYFDFGTNDLSTTIFSDFAQTIPITNPVERDSTGKCPPVYTAAAFYRLESLDAAGSVLDTIEQFQGTGTDEGRSAHDWNSTVTYQLNDLVESAEKYYFATQNNNLGNQPTGLDTDPFWQFAPFLKSWNSTITFAINDIVVEDGLIYKARTVNLGKLPSDNPADWANTSGIGIETINISGAGFLVPSTEETRVTSRTLSNIFVSATDFSGTVTQSAQFSFLMPDSYDNTVALKARVTYFQPTTAAGAGEVATFVVTAIGAADSIAFNTLSFSPTTIFEDLTGVDALTQYISPTFDVNMGSNPAPNSQMYFQLLRLGATDTSGVTTSIKEITIYMATTSSTDNA